jgi:hypothetical protein
MAPARHGEPANPRIIGSRSGVHHGAPAGTLAFSSVMKVMHHAAMRRRMRTAMEVEMTNVPLAPALIAFLAAASPAAPQPAQPQTGGATEESILVEGTRTDPRAIVRDTINRAGVAPLARFEDKICPGIVGLSGAQADKLVQMIRENVVQLGGKVDEPGCTANATVIFTDQPLEFVKKMAKAQPGYFDLAPRALEQFTAQPRAVASWHVTDTRDRDGQETGSAGKASQRKKLFDANVSVSSPVSAKVVRQSAATRLYTNTREDMLVAFAVIDRQKSPGKSLRQLADLATLHLLLDIKQDAGTANRGSILSLFEDRPAGAAPPTALTQFDRAMVEALYTPPENNRTPAQQFTQIATALRKSAESGKQ